MLRRVRSDLMTILVIGNGFDIALGLDTSFKTIINKYLDANPNPILKNELSTKEFWYDYEGWLGKQSMITDMAKVEEVKIEHEKFKKFMKDYLNNITLDPMSLKVQEMIDKLAPYNFNKVISYNYTKFYQCIPSLQNVEAVHINGSLEEDNIVLGYSDIIHENTNILGVYLKTSQRTLMQYREKYPYDINESDKYVIYGHSLDITDRDTIQEMGNSWSGYSIINPAFDQTFLNLKRCFASDTAKQKELDSKLEVII